MKRAKNLFKNRSFLQDVFFLFIITLFVLLEIYLLTGSVYICGSTVDWLTQHSVLPDYFRQSFYETKNLFPEFNLNLGGGQNAFNFSYYGFMNPIILISYFLPSVPMEVYISVSSIIVVLLSIYIFYFWVKSNGYVSNKALYLVTILFACAGPLLYHSHKQVMFMDYIPFLLLAFIGVDMLFSKNKKALLIISIALMFLTSYFFAVSGMAAISIYALFKYFQLKDSENSLSIIPEGKNPFLYFGLRFFANAIIGIMLPCVILLPSFSAILAGRGADTTSNNLSLLNLLIPQFPSDSLFYMPYGIGITGITGLALLYCAFMKKNNSIRFLSLCMIFISAFPIVQYILNGCLYARGKSLIPFMPLVVLLASFFLQDIFERKINTKKFFTGFVLLIIVTLPQFLIGKNDTHLIALILTDLMITGTMLFISYKFNKSVILIIPVVAISVCSLNTSNFSDELISKSDAKKYYSIDRSQALSRALDKDDNFCRSSNITDSKFTNNIIYNRRYFSEGCYSSIFNKYYLNMCNYDLNLNNPTVNNISITSSNDVLFKMLMGVKYVTSTSTAPAGYSPVCHSNNIKVFKSDDVYSLGFASPYIMSLEEYKSLSPEDKELSLLKYIVVDKKMPYRYNSLLKKEDYNFNFNSPKNNDGFYHITTHDSEKTYYFDLQDNLKDYVYIIKCNIKQRTRRRATILINGIQNSLSSLDSAYPNQNYNFKFVVSDCSDNNHLKVTFPKKSNFEFSEFEIYKVKYSDVANFKKEMTMMTDISYENNVISGKINLDNDSFFTTTIPYDTGFSVYVDGQKTEYELTDNAFIGFPLKKGAHKITLVYHAPLIKTGKYVSLFGFILLIIFCRNEFINIDFKSKGTL